MFYYFNFGNRRKPDFCHGHETPNPKSKWTRTKVNFPSEKRRGFLPGNNYTYIFGIHVTSHVILDDYTLELYDVSNVIYLKVLHVWYYLGSKVPKP